ncbi:MAG: hypothetical protein K8S62_06880 [Candidatus Sabulitectum sp.]|nr:hypothetical protein [Candidatus Sabulitectum sp.]
MRNGKLGCLLWVALASIVVLWGWKLIDFYILGPAVVKKGMNETVDQVSILNNTAAKKVEFLVKWSEWRAGCSIGFTQCSFEGDTFVVRWADTLHIPVFPSIRHTFRLKKAVI